MTKNKAPQPTIFAQTDHSKHGYAPVNGRGWRHHQYPAEELARLLHTDLVILPDSNHVSYLLEQPDMLLPNLTAFLDAPMPADK